MIEEQAKVADFHRAMGLEIGTSGPEMLTEAAANRRIRLIDEEFDEFVEAFERDNLVSMVDSLCDLLYVTYGTAVEMGVDLEEYFEEVHDSNMTKLGGHFNEFGKWIKPESYRPADIASLLEEDTNTLVAWESEEA